jgi:ribosomal-protein-alanine N-acetyltransferase
MKNICKIHTERFLLRNLNSEDVSERYLSWLNDATAKKFIKAASDENSLSDLRKFIAEKENRIDVLFLGIFDLSTGLHIGNIKYEPIDLVNRYAVMGIMIGDVNYRSKGVAGEVITASSRWLNKNRNISEIILGVHKVNLAAVKAYEKIGFVPTSTPHIKINDSEHQIMKLDL